MTKLVLIVEDNALNMKIFDQLLRTSGFETLCAYDAESALEFLETHRPDLILTDIHLPGMSGVDLMRRLKENAASHDIPVIAATASPSNAVERVMMELGCRAYLQKPVPMTDLLLTVARHAA